MNRSERVERLRLRAITTPAVCLERAKYYTESYKKTEALPTVLRRAMADYRRGEAELPGLVNGIFLGDRVQFDTGREWLVIRVRWKQSGSTARTHLELADPTYADLYG